MTQVDDVIEIEREPAEVFAVLTDPALLPEWQKGTVSVERSGSGPLAVGERLDEVHRAFGRSMPSVVEVTLVEAPRAFALRLVEGALPFDGEWTLEPVSGGTRLVFRGELHKGGRMMRAVVARQFRAHHRRLRALVLAR